MTRHHYLIALGSNQRHAALGNPHRILMHAIEALEMADIDVFSVAPIINSAPVGPSKKHYANSAAILSSPLEPPALLQHLHQLEQHFDRRRIGQKWQARTLDLDIILWSGGIWAGASPLLSIPHISFRSRSFVLSPAAAIAPDWRDPVTSLSIRQLFHRLIRAKRVDR